MSPRRGTQPPARQGRAARLLLLAAALSGSGATAPADGTRPRMTFCFPDSLSVEFGTVEFGAEPPRRAGRAAGLTFQVREVAPADGGSLVFGLDRCPEGRFQVWRARTPDGFVYEDAAMLFEIPGEDGEPRWLEADLARRDRALLLLAYRLGDPPEAGHPVFAYAGAIDGGGWRRLSDAPLYLGQDAFGLTWDAARNRFVNYQTAFQPRGKRFPDVVPRARRALHIRTSPDGLRWTPGGSFGADGPHLPLQSLILPDERDPEDAEFYRFRPIRLDGLHAGVMAVFVSQPPRVPRATTHWRTPFLALEWWVSRDGIRWQRPFRERSGLDGAPELFAGTLPQPVPAGGELRWAVPGGDVYALDRGRMFYVYARAPAEIATPAFELSGRPLELEVAFDSLRRGEHGMMRQGYLMAELLDGSGRVLPGFERERCVFVPDDGLERLVLQWGGRQLPDGGAGRRVRLRLLIRDVRVYSLAH